MNTTWAEACRAWVMPGDDRDQSERMASAAREMQEQDRTGQVFDSAVGLAVRNIPGCDAAGISILHRGAGVDTPAATSPEAARADELQ